LTSEEYDKHIGSDKDCMDELLKDPGGYKRLVGRLLYPNLALTPRGTFTFLEFYVIHWLNSPKIKHKCAQTHA